MEGRGKVQILSYQFLVHPACAICDRRLFITSEFYLPIVFIAIRSGDVSYWPNLKRKNAFWNYFRILFDFGAEFDAWLIDLIIFVKINFDQSINQSTAKCVQWRFSTVRERLAMSKSLNVALTGDWLTWLYFWLCLLQFCTYSVCQTINRRVLGMIQYSRQFGSST